MKVEGTCPACGSKASPEDQVCFQCGRFLRAIVTRGSVVASRYEVMSPLGGGGTATLYKATDRQAGAFVVLEVLRPDWTERPEMVGRFHSEMKLLQKLVHPNLCRTLDSGEDRGIVYHVHELIEGPTLKETIKARKGLVPEEAYPIAIELADAVQTLHKAGIVHRSIKSSNVILVDGEAKLTGFANVKALAAPRAPRTMTGPILGNVDYASPEQAKGEAVSFASDIYSLGVVIYEAFTGVLPFRGRTPYAVLMKHLQEPPVLEGAEASRIPRGLVPVLRKALAKDPPRRFQMVRHLAEALRHARSEGAMADPMALLSALNPRDATVKVNLEELNRLIDPGFDTGSLLKALGGRRRRPRPGAAAPQKVPPSPSKEEALRTLLKALREKDAAERNETFDALGLMGPATRNALTDALNDEDPVVRDIANDAIRRILSRVRSGGPSSSE